MTFRIPTLKITMKRSATLFASLMLVVACGQADRFPLGSLDIATPDLTSTRQNMNDNGTFVLSFTGNPAVLDRPMAFKKARSATSKQHASKFIGKRGGTLKVKFSHAKADNRTVVVKQAQFTVKGNSISEPSIVGMTVYSETSLSDVGWFLKSQDWRLIHRRS